MLWDDLGAEGQDLAEGERLKSEGMSRAARGDPATTEMLAVVARRLAARGGTFSSDDVWRELGVPPEDNRSIGSVFVALARQGVITRVEYVKSKRPKQHATMISLWMGTPLA
jgi:hypothetical protein